MKYVISLYKCSMLVVSIATGTLHSIYVQK